MLKLVFLSSAFYADYASCKEIEKKPLRPHAQVTVDLDGLMFCVPFRSHIAHQYAIMTDKRNSRGLDFSKAVVITDEAKYIVPDKAPHISEDEFAVVKTISDYEVAKRLKAYIGKYKRAKANPTMERNARLLKYSTLQYFEKEIGL